MSDLFGSTSGEITYASDAKANLERGTAALRSNDFPTAEKYFEYVRTKYPYSDFAKEAELRLADLAWQKDDFTDAKDRYTNFVKLHPGHARVDYAAYRAAAANFQDFKKQASDFFLFPPSYEKDQTALKTAVTALNDFIEGYPQSKYQVDAKKLLTESRHRLAAHEMYVAGYYAHHSRWPGAVSRWEGVVKDFAYLGEDLDAAFHLADVYQRHLMAPEKANQVLRLIMDRYPNTPAAAKAERLLSTAPGKPG
jgi:outer membrane protein assembly factor BamD